MQACRKHTNGRLDGSMAEVKTELLICDAQIKGYRDLAKTLLEANAELKRGKLDLDSPQFQAALTGIAGTIVWVLRKNGYTEDVVKNLNMQFRDRYVETLPDLKREVDEVRRAQSL